MPAAEPPGRQDKKVKQAMSRILVIDDDGEVRTTIKMMLESAGYAVSEAADGEEGLRQFQREHFDLVICDIFMPKKEGLETVRDLRRMAADVPILSMSGGTPGGRQLGDAPDPDFLRMTTMIGATRRIGKPFTRLQLLTVVAECLHPPASSAAGT
jgi:CheY-like chemotaxis protein